MDLDRLRNSPVGRLIPITAPDPSTREPVAGEAFLPDPLPASLTLSTATWNRVTPPPRRWHDWTAPRG